MLPLKTPVKWNLYPTCRQNVSSFRYFGFNGHAICMTLFPRGYQLACETKIFSTRVARVTLSPRDNVCHMNKALNIKYL